MHVIKTGRQRTLVGGVGSRIRSHTRGSLAALHERPLSGDQLHAEPPLERESTAVTSSMPPLCERWRPGTPCKQTGCVWRDEQQSKLATVCNRTVKKLPACAKTTPHGAILPRSLPKPRISGAEAVGAVTGGGDGAWARLSR